MKKLLLILTMALFLLPGKGQNRFSFDNEATFYRNYNDSTGNYLIKYEYNTWSSISTLMWPPDANYTAYNALITVYQVVMGDTIQIGNSFEGYYSPDGWMDNPVSHVREANNNIDIIESVPIRDDSIYLYQKELQIDSLIWEKPTKFAPEAIIHISVTLTDLFDYQKECYNDSTEVGYSYTWNTTYYPDGSISSYMGKDCYCICSMYDENIKDWKQFDCEDCIYPEDFKAKQGFNYDTYKPILYRKEPTLTGFIEYMKRKYKVK